MTVATKIEVGTRVRVSEPHHPDFGKEGPVVAVTDTPLWPIRVDLGNNYSNPYTGAPGQPMAESELEVIA